MLSNYRLESPQTHLQLRNNCICFVFKFLWPLFANIVDKQHDAKGQFFVSSSNKIVDKFPSVTGKVRTIVYPVDTDLFHPRRTIQEKNSDSYILFTGRINDPRKNVGMLFKAFARVLTELSDVRLVLTGDEPNDYLLESA